MPSSSSLSPPRRIPKLGHKKSMFGCQRCRSRKVKCNEAKPICHNCERHGLPCVYDREKFVNAPETSAPAAPLLPDEFEEVDLPESRERRMLELRLMRQYILSTADTIAIDDVTADWFGRSVPKLAIGCDALLYAMYAVAALHMAKLGTVHNLGVEDAASIYTAMAVREHTKDVSQITSETADAVCLTSCMMRVISLLQLADRSREPYAPPWQWLAVTQTSTSTFREAWELLGPESESESIQIMKRTWHFHRGGQKPKQYKLDRLKHLMDRPEEIQAIERWDADIQEAYSVTLHYISSIIDLADEEDSSNTVFRMCITFPMIVDRRYVELVREGSPRALVVLAHFFALLGKFDHCWWAAGVGYNEVCAIVAAVPDEWQSLLAWPLKTIKK
ncbi:C6 finger domain-containing protein [Hypoxylon sp. NC1633]|nr:C6 finger domain-containing protein [Hypoxylon sp. NC1633]